MQKDIYEVVLATFKECLKFYRPGGTLQEIHRAAVSVLAPKVYHFLVIEYKLFFVVLKNINNF